MPPPQGRAQTLDLVASGTSDPVDVLTVVEPLVGAVKAYAAVDGRRPGRLKVESRPAAE